MKAADIPEAEIIAAIEQVGRTIGKGAIGGKVIPKLACLWDLQEALPAYPPKVVLARLKSMVKRKVIGAQCTCGCRGDFTTDPNFWYGGK